MHQHGALVVCNSQEVGLQGALGLSGGAWSANWQITKSTKCVHLLRRLMDIGVVPDCPSPQVHYTDYTGCNLATALAQSCILLMGT